MGNSMTTLEEPSEAETNECTPGLHIMRIHLVQNSTSARFGKKPFNIHLVRIYPTSVSEKNYALSKNSH